MSHAALALGLVAAAVAVGTSPLGRGGRMTLLLACAIGIVAAFLHAVEVLFA